MGVAITALCRSWWIRIGGSVAFLFVIVSGLVAVNSAYDTSASLWDKAEIAYSYAATPWLGLMMLFVVGAMLFFGIQDVKKAIKEARPTREQEIILLIEERAVRERETAELHRYTDQFSEQFRVYEAKFNDWVRAEREGFQVRDEIVGILDGNHFNFAQPELRTIALPVLDQNWGQLRPDFSVVINQHDPAARHRAARFDPAYQPNALWIIAERQNIERCRAYMHHLQDCRMRQNAAQGNYDRIIKERLFPNA